MEAFKMKKLVKFALTGTVLLSVALSGCQVQGKSAYAQNPSATVSTTTPNPQHDQKQDITPKFDRVYVGQTALDSALSAINGAKSSIDLDMYEFTNPFILKSLKDAKARGVKERIVLDDSSSKAADELKKQGIEVHVEAVSGGINHVKYLAIDEQFVLLGSVNFGAGSGKNEDASIWVPFKSDEKDFFDAVWTGREPFMNGPTLFNRKASQNEAIQLIDNAKKSVLIGMFAWTESSTIKAVINAKKRGIAVTAYIDGHQKENKKTIQALKSSGVPVIVAQTSQWLHLKGLVVDETVTFMGSANWSHNGFYNNHELNFVTSSPNIAKGIKNLLSQTNN
jgi:phosphatidylserine/phosphatidylglycerophosphate/cardiolipin synthase-like enzyme